jgi:hypothetical protein
MHKLNQWIGAACLAFALVPLVHAQPKTASEEKALTLIHRYKLPASIRWHFDHFSVDAEGKRLFGTAVEDKKVVVFNLSKGVMAHGIAGVEEPRAAHLTATAWP